jgi:hypothetical protein
MNFGKWFLKNREIAQIPCFAIYKFTQQKPFDGLFEKSIFLKLTKSGHCIIFKE